MDQDLYICPRRRIINELERRMAGAVRVLKLTYRHDLVLIWQNCQKEIEIQQAYLQHEG